MALLILNDEDLQSEQITINELTSKFQALGVNIKKSVQLARFLIEPPSETDIIFNENLKDDVQSVIDKLQKLIGFYYLYRDASNNTISEHDDDQNTIQEEYMQKLVYENFNNYKETFVMALQCEDYEEEGKLELSQLLEAIVEVREDLEKSVLDYMLYYVLIRSENHD